jgi:hypothetical protein
MNGIQKNSHFLISRVVSVFALILSLASAPVGVKADLIDHTKSTLTDGFDATGLIILTLGAAATAVAFNHDMQMRQNWENQQKMCESTSKLGDYWGMGIAQGAIALTQLVFDTENGVAMTEALLASTAVTYGIKFGSQRSRPGSDSHNSFPSGHTQIAFASATALHMSYGFWKALPFYSLGVFTGLSRIADNAHWLSDVVAGATVGVFFGRAPFKHHGSIYPAYYHDGNSEVYALQGSWSW